MRGKCTEVYYVRVREKKGAEHREGNAAAKEREKEREKEGGKSLNTNTACFSCSVNSMRGVFTFLSLPQFFLSVSENKKEGARVHKQHFFHRIITVISSSGWATSLRVQYKNK